MLIIGKLHGLDFVRYFFIKLLISGLQFFNQASGISIVNLYCTQIFAASGIDPKIGTFIVGLANFFGSLVPLPLIKCMLEFS